MLATFNKLQIISLQVALVTLMAPQMKSVTNLMENVFAQMDTMETNANLVSQQFQDLFKNLQTLL